MDAFFSTDLKKIVKTNDQSVDLEILKKEVAQLSLQSNTLPPKKIAKEQTQEKSIDEQEAFKKIAEDLNIEPNQKNLGVIKKFVEKGYLPSSQDIKQVSELLDSIPEEHQEEALDVLVSLVSNQIQISDSELSDSIKHFPEADQQTHLAKELKHEIINSELPSQVKVEMSHIIEKSHDIETPKNINYKKDEVQQRSAVEKKITSTVQEFSSNEKPNIRLRLLEQTEQLRNTLEHEATKMLLSNNQLQKIRTETSRISSNLHEFQATDKQLEVHAKTLTDITEKIKEISSFEQSFIAKDIDKENPVHGQNVAIDKKLVSKKSEPTNNSYHGVPKQKYFKESFGKDTINNSKRPDQIFSENAKEIKTDNITRNEDATFQNILEPVQKTLEDIQKIFGIKFNQNKVENINESNEGVKELKQINVDPLAEEKILDKDLPLPVKELKHFFATNTQKKLIETGESVLNGIKSSISLGENVESNTLEIINQVDLLPRSFVATHHISANTMAEAQKESIRVMKEFIVPKLRAIGVQKLPEGAEIKKLLHEMQLRVEDPPLPIEKVNNDLQGAVNVKIEPQKLNAEMASIETLQSNEKHSLESFFAKLLYIHQFHQSAKKEFDNPEAQQMTTLAKVEIASETKGKKTTLPLLPKGTLHNEDLIASKHMVEVDDVEVSDNNDLVQTESQGGTDKTNKLPWIQEVAQDPTMESNSLEQTLTNLREPTEQSKNKKIPEALVSPKEYFGFSKNHNEVSSQKVSSLKSFDLPLDKFPDEPSENLVDLTKEKKVERSLENASVSSQNHQVDIQKEGTNEKPLEKNLDVTGKMLVSHIKLSESSESLEVGGLRETQNLEKLPSNEKPLSLLKIENKAEKIPYLLRHVNRETGMVVKGMTKRLSQMENSLSKLADYIEKAIFDRDDNLAHRGEIKLGFNSLENRSSENSAQIDTNQIKKSLINKMGENVDLVQKKGSLSSLTFEKKSPEEVELQSEDLNDSFFLKPDIQKPVLQESISNTTENMKKVSLHLSEDQGALPINEMNQEKNYHTDNAKKTIAPVSDFSEDPIESSKQTEQNMMRSDFAPLENDFEALDVNSVDENMKIEIRKIVNQLKSFETKVSTGADAYLGAMNQLVDDISVWLKEWSQEIFFEEFEDMQSSSTKKKMILEELSKVVRDLEVDMEKYQVNKNSLSAKEAQQLKGQIIDEYQSIQEMMHRLEKHLIENDSQLKEIKKVSDLIQKFENRQLMQTVSDRANLQSEQVQRFVVSVDPKVEAQPVSIEMRQEKFLKDKKEVKQYDISIELDLSNIGEISAKIQMSPNNKSIQFLMPNQEMKSLAEKESIGLVDRLKEIPFFAQISFLANEKASQSPSKKVGIKSTHQFDIKG